MLSTPSVPFARFAVAFAESMKEVACLQWVCVPAAWPFSWCREADRRCSGSRHGPVTLPVAASGPLRSPHSDALMCLAPVKTPLGSSMGLWSSKRSPGAKPCHVSSVSFP